MRCYSVDVRQPSAPEYSIFVAISAFTLDVDGNAVIVNCILMVCVIVYFDLVTAGVLNRHGNRLVGAPLVRTVCLDWEYGSIPLEVSW